ncbi:creatinase domain-containing protein, partial [Cardiosporidium cionae]
MRDVSGFYSVDVESFKIWLDPCINIAVYKSIPDPQNNSILEQSPVTLPKAIKTTEELQGMREAHIKDGMAECKFFTWLESVKEDGSLFSMTELTLSDKIDGFRAEQDTFVSLSFPSISGIGPNGAIIHYRPEVGSCSKITPS